jgi:hypothetical protein
MDIAQTDPSQLAVPFADLVAAARAWEDSSQRIGRAVSALARTGAAGAGPECAGPRVGPVLAERLGNWCARATDVARCAADHADAIRACVASSTATDVEVAASFRMGTS